MDENSPKKFQRIYLQNQKHILELLLNFRNLHKILKILEKKDHRHTFNISRVTDNEKCGSLNAQRILFQNTLRKVTC